MIIGDLIGVISVYLYVSVLVIISEKLSDSYPFLGRKILHIMVGNILFLLPLFETRWVMAGIAAAPFIGITFLLSPYSSIDLADEISSTGHGLGLVYYSISWTVLATFFFHRLDVIAVGIVSMSYGDGFASVIGQKYGTHKFNVSGNQKSLEGSLGMFVITSLMMFIALLYYGKLPNSLFLIPLVMFFATIFEGTTPKGLDNLSASLSGAIIYYVIVYLVVL